MKQEKQEIWKKISDYKDYDVSNFGRVRSRLFGKIKILKQTINKHGYYMVGVGSIKKGKKRKTYETHRLVALAFCCNNNSYRNEVDHIDRNSRNNNFKNLRWSTRKENLLNCENPRIMGFSLEEAQEKIYFVNKCRMINIPKCFEGKKIKLKLLVN